MTHSSSPVIVWFRDDLRLDDHPALLAAAASDHGLLPVYLREQHAGETPGAASHWWLHHSLKAHQRRLRGLGLDLVIRQGPAEQAIPDLVEQSGAAQVFALRRYEPRARQVDQTLQASLPVPLTLLSGTQFLEPDEILTGDGNPYRVFTPFWKRCLERLTELHPASEPAQVRAADVQPESLSVEQLDLLPQLDWADGFGAIWQPGEQGAHQVLQNFQDQALNGYGSERDRPDLIGTSRLSPHLHFGEISVRRILQVLRDHWRSEPRVRADAQSYVRELGWREFSRHLLAHFPDSVSEPLNGKFSALPWREDDVHLRAWQRGQTGIPLVDAGMRELWQTGWMHNRVRMVVASFLTKNLRLHWLEGAHWFNDTLVDADLANNTQGWQWTAGCGADAAPYFRIFNPIRQSERFDPNAEYVTRWIPELASLPVRYRHAPWQTPAPILQAAGLELGRDYPHPIVDLAETRRAALDAYEMVKAAVA